MKLYRASGLPIEPGDAQIIKDLFKAKFAEIEATYGKATQENSHIFTPELQALEDECVAKYPRSRDIELTDVPAVIEEFKCAVAITKAMIDNQEQLAAYLMDNQ